MSAGLDACKDGATSCEEMLDGAVCASSDGVDANGVDLTDGLRVDLRSEFTSAKDICGDLNSDRVDREGEAGSGML